MKMNNAIIQVRYFSTFAKICSPKSCDVSQPPVEPAGHAVVELHEARGSGVTGTLIVERNSQGKIRIVGTVHGLEPGTHGFHVHEHGSIGNDCMDAGGHFNPYNVSGLYILFLSIVLFLD